MIEEDRIIWRYMNPYVFISQLIREELLFVRITRMEDKTESLLKEKSIYECIEPGGRNKKSFDKERKATLEKIKEKAEDHFISSWTYREEDLTFWQHFSSKNGGIAIKTKSSKVFNNIPASIKLTGQTIIYYPLKNKKFSLDPFSVEHRVFSKFKDFSFEQEYRFAIYCPNLILDDKCKDDFKTIKVDFNNIIENVIISPLMRKSDYHYLLDTIKEIDMRIFDKIEISSFSYLQNQ